MNELSHNENTFETKQSKSRTKSEVRPKAQFLSNKSPTNSRRPPLARSPSCFADES